MSISREQIMRRLRDAGFHFKRQGKVNEIWMKSGTSQRVNLCTRKSHDEQYTRLVLRQAGLTPEEIKEFVAAAVK